ncbi:LysR family transcriptional regulator [Rhodococcus erythropolis]
MFTRVVYDTSWLSQNHFISRVRRRDCMSLQGLSRSITELEHDVGVPLFTRTTRAVELTDSGASFLRATRQALTVLDEGAADAHRVHARMSGVLRSASLRHPRWN